MTQAAQQIQTPEPPQAGSIADLQQTLTGAMAAADAAQTLVLSLRQQVNIQDQKLVALSDNVANARGALGLATSTAEIAEAKAAYQELQAAYPLEEIRLEGLESKLALSETNAERANRAVCKWTGELAVAIAGTVEAEALRCAEKLGPLMRKRLQLAKIASSNATRATGSDNVIDPLGGTTFGERTRFSDEVQELLRPMNASTPTLSAVDLLAWP